MSVGVSWKQLHSFWPFTLRDTYIFARVQDRREVRRTTYKGGLENTQEESYGVHALGAPSNSLERGDNAPDNHRCTQPYARAEDAHASRDC